MMRLMNLTLLVVWGGVAVGLFFRDQFLAEAYRTPEWQRRLALAMFAAGVLAVWNLFRLSRARRTNGARAGIAREGIASPLRQARPTAEVRHPEFDFGRDPTPPSTPGPG